MPWPVGRPGRNKGIPHSMEARKKMSATLLERYGGRTITTGGYVYIMKPEHPHATKSGYIMEHRLIMEEHLGRILSKDEDIHHINKNKKDNRLENLQLLTKSEHGKIENPTIDMSHRRCALCLSNKTKIDPKNGRPHWQHIGRLLVCDKCYMEDYARKKHDSA